MTLACQALNENNLLLLCGLVMVQKQSTQIILLENTITMFRIALSASRTIAVVFLFNMIVACTVTQDPPAQTFGDPIEGVWLLGDKLSSISIAPCGSNIDDGLCGTLMQISEGDGSWGNQSNAEWWQKSPTPTITHLRPTEVEGKYIGFMYDSEIDETLHLQLVLANDSAIEAIVYFGADLDEAVDMAVGASFSPARVTNLS